MTVLSCFVLCLVLCGTIEANTGKANLLDAHHLIKRQAQAAGLDTASYTQRHFVSPEGEPYYEYQPPVSSSRGLSQGSQASSHALIGGASSGRQATSKVTIDGRPSMRLPKPHLDVASPRQIATNTVASTGPRGRTYTYPFGRERVQYTGSQSQVHDKQAQRSPDSEAGTDWQQEAVQPQRQHPSLSSSRQRSVLSNYHNDSSQISSNQQSRYEATALQEQELRRRQNEMRRRHEDERRRQVDERRILLEKRRRQEEERKRRYYGQQQPHVRENNHVFQPNFTRHEHLGLTDNRPQQPNVQPDTERQVVFAYPSGQHYPYKTETTNQRENQQVPITPLSQVTNSSLQPEGYPTQHKPVWPVYSSLQGTSPNQLGYRTNSSHYPVPHNTPHQQTGFSQEYNRQSAQVDPNFQTSQSSFPSSNSTSEKIRQGHGQGYPYQERGPNFGSYFSFEQQDNDSDCPDTGIDLRINGLDCQQAVKQFGGYLCYTHEYTSRDCCQVCQQRKQTLQTGCEFGDHAELCMSIASADCYDLRNRYSCCQTCEKLRRKNLPASCEYGDMTIRCENVRQNPGLCYIPDNQRLCCETCSQIRNTTNQGCPWGDYNSNLCQLFEENTANVRINCYSQQRRKLCCQSCDRLREWISGGLPADCQYGDRPVIFTTSQFGRLNCSNLFSYFSLDECRTNPAVAINCCQTCHRLLNSRGLK